MKVIKFLIYQNLTGELGGLYYSDVPGDSSGEYVSLAEYQDLQKTLSQITEALEYFEKEYYKSKRLLKRWNEIAPDIFDDISLYEQEQSPELAQLIQDTQETLE